MHPNLSRAIPAGNIIKPWLILGPFYEDFSETVQGLTLFEKPGAKVGSAAMTQVVAEAQTILSSRPVEGEESSFRDQVSHWELVRSPEQYLSWGRYNISNHLGAAFLTTLLTPDLPGTQAWRLISGTSRAIVAINGTVVYDTDAHPAQAVGNVYEYRFDAALSAGENTITVGLFRLGRMAQVGFRLEANIGLRAGVPLAPDVPIEVRDAVEEQLGSIRLSRDVFYGEHEIGLRLGGFAPGPQDQVAPDKQALLTVSLRRENGETLRATTPAPDGRARSEEQKVMICRGDELADGHYELSCRWETPDRRPLTDVSFDIHKLTPAPDMPGQVSLSERMHQVLRHYASFQRSEHRPDIWREVARYALGGEAEWIAAGHALDEGVIADTCQFIAARKDCADFVIQAILRLMCWERNRDTPNLSPQIHAMMKDTVLGFKYWVDEPGDTVMYMGSENHRLLFHVAEWLAGKLFPTEEFTNSGMRGLYHTTKGMTYITEWLRQRGRFGFDEWHSNSYYPVCIAPLLNVYDFAAHEGEQKLRQMTGLVLDYMFFNLAADSFEGILGTTHGRSYGINLKYPDFEGTSATNWLLFGTGSLSWGTSGMSPVSLATSEYRAPGILADIATDKEAVVESKIRQGILKGTARHADFVVFRTPDYMISGLQDHRKGEFESSTHVAQVTMGNKTTVFWSCPHATGEGSGLRPDYWSGHSTLPRVVQHRNVLALTWRLNWSVWMSHCWFEQERFDEVRLVGAWAFARVGKGYIGIFSQHGFVVGAEGQYAGRELQCSAAENTWLVECGREADWGSFDAFVDALLAAPVESKEGIITYTSPSVGTFVTGWDTTPMINGEPIQLHGYPLVKSAWAQSAFGSGELVVRHGGQEYEVWFNQ